MRKVFILITFLSVVSIVAVAQTKINLAAGDKSMTATLADNEATRKLVSLLSDEPMTIKMEDYGGFEKVGALPQPLPTADSHITTAPGDIMLYHGNNLVIFYGQNSWSYTRIGKIDGATASSLRAFLGDGSVSLTITLDTTAGIDAIETNDSANGTVYDLKGNPADPRRLSPGIYIINGRKTVVR